GYGNFATQHWNACRFAEMNAFVTPAAFDPAKATETLNRWIAHETARTTREVGEAITTYRFNDAAGATYRFVRDVYCDWYLELAKPVLMAADGDAKRETQAMVAWVRDEILKLLHPFMPFLTEELWAVTAAVEREQTLALTAWSSGPAFYDPKAEAEIGWVIDVTSAIRSVRAEMKVSAPIPLVFA